MTEQRSYLYPFTAIVGQDKMKQALLLNVINPMLGGIVIRGEKGTAKSTAVRALANVPDDLRVVNLPVSATEDRVVGTLDIEHAIQYGEKKFEPGLLAEPMAIFCTLMKLTYLKTISSIPYWMQRPWGQIRLNEKGSRSRTRHDLSWLAQ